MAEMKIILLGESGVGKTSFLLRFCKGEFSETLPPSPTLRLENHSKSIQVDDQEIKLDLWDTAGQERFRKNAMASNYFRSAEGVLLLYDVTDLRSFYKLSGWVDHMRIYNEDAPFLIVGNKNEDPGRKSVNVSTVEKFVNRLDQINLDHIEISVKTGENVQEALLCLAKKVLMARKAAMAKKAAAQGFNYLTEKKDEDIIKLEKKDASIQTEPKSWCCFF